MPPLSFALYVSSLHPSLLLLAAPSPVITAHRLESLSWSRKGLGRWGVKRTALNYRKVKSFAQGHSIRQC